jgi:hypothetical protein
LIEQDESKPSIGNLFEQIYTDINENKSSLKKISVDVKQLIIEGRKNKRNASFDDNRQMLIDNQPKKKGRPKKNYPIAQNLEETIAESTDFIDNSSQKETYYTPSTERIGYYNIMENPHVKKSIAPNASQILLRSKKNQIGQGIWKTKKFF